MIKKYLFLFLFLFSATVKAELPTPILLTEASHALGAFQYNCLSNGICYIRMSWYLDAAAPMMTCVRMPNAPLAVTNGWKGIKDYDPALTGQISFGGMTADEIAACTSDVISPPLMSWKTKPINGFFVTVWNDDFMRYKAWEGIDTLPKTGGTPCEPETIIFVAESPLSQNFSAGSYHYVRGQHGKRGLAVCTLQP